MTDEADKPVVPTTQATGRSGRAIVSPIVESTAVSPSAGPCFDDCYTPLLYNPDRDPGSSYWKGVENWTVGCDTNRLHNRVHFASRGGRLCCRRRVPASLPAADYRLHEGARWVDHGRGC